MSPASYRAAPPRVVIPTLAHDPPGRKIHSAGHLPNRGRPRGTVHDWRGLTRRGGTDGGDRGRGAGGVDPGQLRVELLHRRVELGEGRALGLEVARCLSCPQLVEGRLDLRGGRLELR